jgi:hypothetical protein
VIRRWWRLIERKSIPYSYSCVVPHSLLILGLTSSTSQAGLFSAVLTAFVVQSYQSLQENYMKTSADLLRQISHQLANPSFPAAPNSSQFQAQRSDVQVNVCWFVSLLLSLVVALFGIFLKQWMRSYMKWTDATPDREAVALRQFRHRGLKNWRLEAILTLLPTLLQLSVILFLSGLLVFLWNLDRMVARVMAGLLIITFCLVAIVTVLPAVSKTCPYRSPLSEILALSLWKLADYRQFLYNFTWVFIKSGWTYSPESLPWEEFAKWWRNRSKIRTRVQADEVMIVRHHRSGDHVSMHVGAMVHLCRTTQSQDLWSAAITAIVKEPPAENLTSPRGIGDVYCNEVWVPVLACASLFAEKHLKFEAGRSYWSTLRMSTSSAFGRLSLPMKQCWVELLLHSKTFVCQSTSSRVVVSYMICCLAGLESTTGGPRMQAFMEVLKAQYANSQESYIDGIASLLTWDSVPVHEALLDSRVGLSFSGRIIS